MEQQWLYSWQNGEYAWHTRRTKGPVRKRIFPRNGCSRQ